MLQQVHKETSTNCNSYNINYKKCCKLLTSCSNVSCCMYYFSLIVFNKNKKYIKIKIKKLTQLKSIQ